MLAAFFASLRQAELHTDERFRDIEIHITLLTLTIYLTDALVHITERKTRKDRIPTDVLTSNRHL